MNSIRVNRGALIVTAEVEISTPPVIHYEWGRERGWTVSTDQPDQRDRPAHLPVYLRIAADLRAAILGGEYAAGEKIPSVARLAEQYGVSAIAARDAVNILEGEGLVEGRRGSGTYVREQRRIVRRAHTRNMREPDASTSPFARDAARAGRRGTWEHHSERDVADLDVAARLGVEPGSPVMRTRYRFLADGEPIQLSVSHEPLEVTGGTPIEWPEDSPALGVVARFDLIGMRIDEWEERVRDRPATAEEIEALALSPRRSHVQTIARTYYVAGRPVETADIVVAVGRYELVYRFPVD